MATVYRCDRCKREEIRHRIHTVKTDGYGWYDLCEPCISEFQDWVRYIATDA